jgi:hypothetical protein
MNALFETMEPRTLLSATISSTQKANLARLATDLAAIHAQSSVTVAQIHQLDSDIAVALKSATARPSTASVTAFKTELKSALNNGPLTASEIKTLAIDFDAILTSAGISRTAAQAVGTDIKGIITASHITKPQAAEIWSDLEAIVITFEANH